MLTYVLAVLAACANATSSVLQREANRQVPKRENLGPKQQAEERRQVRGRDRRLPVGGGHGHVRGRGRAIASGSRTAPFHTRAAATPS
jgi:hypothetical protein